MAEVRADQVRADASGGHHYAVGYPQWADKPYGFANFLRAARFVNSLDNGQLLSKQTGSHGGFNYTTYRVRLSRRTERGHVQPDGAQTARGDAGALLGFVVPSQNEWIKAAYFDPSGGGTYSYWKYPTNPGVFGRPPRDRPQPDHARRDDRRCDQRGDATAGHLPRLGLGPELVSGGGIPERLLVVNPFGIGATNYAKIYQGSLGTVGQAKTIAVGHARPGRQRGRVDRHDHPAPAGKTGGRVWRRLHGGIANAPRYQLWLSAVGLQPQNNALQPHLPVARFPDRRGRRPEDQEGLSSSTSCAAGLMLPMRSMHSPA